MSYQEFAAGLSVVGVALYSLLVGIAFRRARFGRPHESVSDHARRVEGPLVTILLVVALGLLVSALVLNNPTYAETVRYVFGAIRGFMILAGVFVLWSYWQVRETWWPR